MLAKNQLLINTVHGMSSVQNKSTQFLEEAYSGLGFETGVGYCRLSEQDYQVDFSLANWIEQA
ncbi:MAG: hypothetical protein M3R47_12145, partial [Chloroflexota bacterium]|nr:hypothetical protein [Chloroflexota bacterium]